MNLFICGQKDFGAEVYKKLKADGHRIVGVACPVENDRLFSLASADGVLIIPAGTLRAHNLPEGVDLIVAAFCHDFISERVRNKTRFGGIGYHPSLLPRHKGRDAIEWAIRMRDPVTGGTVYWLSNECDGGDIAAQEFCFIYPDDDAKTLYRRDLFGIGVRLIAQVVGEVADGLIVRKKQDRRLATWEPSIDRPPIFKPELPQLPSRRMPETLIKYEAE